MVRVHGLAPLMHVNTRSFHEIPTDVRDILKKNYLYAMRRSLQMASELAVLMGQFDTAGVNVVQLKGITNAVEIFRDTALYPSADIDIMIRREDIRLVTDVMKGLGYRTTKDITDYYLGRYNEVHFLKKAKIAVDFHLSLSNKRYFEIPEDFWWENLREIPMNGSTYKILSKENNLLFASIHMFSHGYSTLKFLVSFSEMFRLYKGNIQWKKLTSDALRFNAYKNLMLSLILAYKLLKAPVPEDIIRQMDIQSFKTKRIIHAIERNIFKNNVSLSKIMFLLTIFQYSTVEVIQRMFKWLLPPLEEISVRYGIPVRSGKIYLYYLLNPFLLLKFKRNN
jgi:hypothetical protein